MTDQPDDQRWLRRIGVTAPETDDAEPADPDANPPPPEEIDPEAIDPGEIDIDGAPTDRSAGIVDLDTDPAHTTTTEDPQPNRRRFTPWVAALFGAAALIATATTAGAAALTSRDPDRAPAAKPALTAHPAAPAPPPTENARNNDAPIPFAASADCPPGSTAAQSIADSHATTPWICARSVDGQVLHIDLGRAYVITAVSIVPGAVDTAAGDGQGDPWLRHRVVTRVQWQFNDVDKTVRNQNTGDVRGEAVQAIPDVLASAITVIIQQTSRPPATAPITTPPGAKDGVLGAILGATPDPQPAQLPGEPPPPDPSDGTFAVTAVKVIGHRAT